MLKSLPTFIPDNIVCFPLAHRHAPEQQSSEKDVKTLCVVAEPTNGGRGDKPSGRFKSSENSRLGQVGQNTGAVSTHMRKTLPHG